MVKTLFGGLSLLNEFNKRNDMDAIHQHMIKFDFEMGNTEKKMKLLLDWCDQQRPCRKGTNINSTKEYNPEQSNNYFGSTGYKHNQKKINNQVGVGAQDHGCCG